MSGAINLQLQNVACFQSQISLKNSSEIFFIKPATTALLP